MLGNEYTGVKGREGFLGRGCAADVESSEALATETAGHFSYPLHSPDRGNFSHMICFDFW